MNLDGFGRKKLRYLFNDNENKFLMIRYRFKQNNYIKI
jgi:hypothetical protein